ncbi:MAG TPA: xanthine dehydrogenase accessory protein XdhC [Thermoanaerobaculia bacterium]|nr:xanthine dehydrogenase accessory protein XdhC [Thermoanaerobaculia bacterium]
MPTFFEQLVDLVNRDTPCVSVTVVDVIGSVPNQRGSKMIVTSEGLFTGTVGGGKVEKLAIEEARKLLQGTLRHGTYFVHWNLNKDVGMTCGGSVKLYFEAFHVGTWRIVIFGAGHVANALISILCTLDCRITCIDPREEWLTRLPDSSKLLKVHSTDMPAEVKTLSDDSFVILMSMGHTTDRPILLEILGTRTFPYVGVIGSKAKAVRLYMDIAEAGLPEEVRRAFFCPIGLPLGTNDPHEIAVSVTAQLLQVRDRLRGEMPAKFAEIEETVAKQD